MSHPRFQRLRLGKKATLNNLRVRSVTIGFPSQRRERMDCRGFETLGLRGETVLASSSRQFVLLLHVIASAHLIFFGLVVVEAFNMKLRIVMCSAPRSTSRSSRLRTSLTSNHHFPANSAQDEPHSPLSRKRFSALAHLGRWRHCTITAAIGYRPDQSLPLPCPIARVVPRWPNGVEPRRADTSPRAC